MPQTDAGPTCQPNKNKNKQKHAGTGRLPHRRWPVLAAGLWHRRHQLQPSPPVTEVNCPRLPSPPTSTKMRTPRNAMLPPSSLSPARNSAFDSPSSAPVVEVAGNQAHWRA
jgi:hypothetical protein